ncbi:Proton pump-interactor 1 [Zea mays]|uniref:Proton pump-interactor 1 n=1 Tax=Zea mays TaxID=4577 RepID=A0A1D6ESD1_MAIZE|nr:Proton pump-interactor 1 [Zea mays]
MTAEGTACNGAGEALKAEFAPEKVVAVSLEEKPVGEREGEDVGGPFLIVNGGDSDGHSEPGSDLGKAPDEDPASEEDDVPTFNAAPDAAVAGDHGTAEGQVGAQGAALGASSADGGDRASDGSEGSADESRGDPSSDCVAEVAQQEAVGEEDSGAAALASRECEPTITSADSEAHYVDSEVEDKEGTVDGSAVVDAVEAVVHQEASTEQDEDAAVMSSGHDDALTSPKSCSAAVESEVIREDSKEQSITDGVEPQQQGTVGASTLVENEHLCADMMADSFVAANEPDSQEDAAVMSSGHDDALTSPKSCSAAVESEVIREDSKEQSITDGVEPQQQGTVGASALVENEHLCVDMAADSFVAATEPDSQEDAAVESCGHDDLLTFTESGSADIESEVYGEDSEQKESNTVVVEIVVQGVGRADVLMANGHLCADTQAGSSEATTEPENHANGSKLTDVAESVEGDAGSGEQDTMDSSQTNGHIYVALSADSCIVPSESKAHSFETDGQRTDQLQEEAPKLEAEVLEGVLKPTERNCAGSVEKLIGEEVGTDGHASIGGTADAYGEQEAKPMQVEGEVTCGILEFEKVDKDGEEGLCDDYTVGVVSSNEETELPMKEKVDEAVPSVNVGGPEKVTDNTSQDTKTVDFIDEITAESNFKAENMVEVKSAAREVDKTEVKDLAFADEANVAPLHLQRDCESVMETIEHEKVELPGGCQAHEIVYSSELEPKKEFEMGVDGAVPLQGAAASVASVFHHEPMSIDLSENDSGNHSGPTTALESCDHVQNEESISQEISMTTIEQPIAIDQVEPVNLNVDELVVDDDQPGFAPRCESARLDKPGCTSKKDDSNEIVEDSKSLENQLEICNAATMSDECSSRNANEDPSPINMSAECSSRTANEGFSPINEASHLAEESCLSDKSYNAISYENGNGPAKSSEEPDKSCNAIICENENEPAKSSDVVETRCVEALAPSSVGTVVTAEQKDNGHRASGEWHGDNVQVIGQQQKIYIIKVPKFAGDDLWNKIQAAQAHLDHLTQERDAINRRRQKQKAVCDQYREKLEAARREEREARTAHGDKKKERTMQHETISLKEEKLLIKEINELKAQRKQLSTTMGSKAEINEAFDQKDHIHERHKVLKKDSDVLLTNLKFLEENTRKIQKSFEDERTGLRKLTEEHRAANEIRQKAYIEWTELRSEPSKKNEYFFRYRDDRNAAEIFRANGDINGLKSHCNSQIEGVMEMWNKNEEFRKQYVESNKVSTLKRLGTHDGRKLGPDEDPPVISSRRPSSIYPLSASSPGVATLASIPAPVVAAPAAVSAKEDSFPVLEAPQTSKRTKSKASDICAQTENNSVIVSEAEALEQTLKEKARLLEEQLELARKAEELARKEEELSKERAAAEKERLRMEQKAKAKEAEERKRRKAEKDKEKAEFKARKEAEEREKKKAKKDKRRGTAPADSSLTGDGHAAALATADTDSNASDNPREAEAPQPAAAPKRLSRPAAAIKQLNRVQPMPAPLRNRGRRRLRQYILIAAAVLSGLALFVAGNYIPRLKSVHS